MTKIEFKKLVKKENNLDISFLEFIKLDREVAKIALKKGWVKPLDPNLICSRRHGYKYIINREIFPFEFISLFHPNTDQIARQIDSDIMNLFLSSTNTHLYNFSEQLNYREE